MKRKRTSTSNSTNRIGLAFAAEELRKTGVQKIDLGTLDTVNAPGLARFKLGSGARAEPLGGTWLSSRLLAPVLCRIPRKTTSA